MPRTAARVTQLRRTARTAAPRWGAGERVEDRSGAAGVVAERHSRTQCLVSYDDGRQVVMYDRSLTITQK